MQPRVRAANLFFLVALLSSLGGAARPAMAQGRANAGKAAAPGQKKKEKVTPAAAVTVTREILVARGYRVARVEVVRDAHVIYFYRGNNGRGRGRGPLEKMIIRPSGDLVVFESAPEQVRIDLRIRLGF
jgi:hypothetical protein